ncbi:transmembrane protein KIAA1109-like [Diaphorina citri]|uniref:Transmembrane protein KIAA1109-like n=1 Tax=Diaphorina citri TaxID=121845 RepID=A0A3Q0J7C8_DIACI|nr:transmembrane protein KIAA1109-like [Diaphorina citri]
MDDVKVTEANLPSEASIDLPKIHVSAEYIQDGGNRPGDIPPTEGVTYRQGSYMSAVADIGIFEHSLTTDLLNHLVFVQKVFMKEVNEVIQKVYGGEKPVPIWEEDEPSSVSLLNYILFSLIVRVKRVQLTATTPTNSAVRLETGSIELQLSNRIQNMSGASNNAGAKLFLKTHVDVNLSLGQVIRNVLFEEADPEFQHYAFFKTQIALRNAFQGEMIQPGSSSDDKEVILISLTRPLVYIQPVAVDKTTWGLNRSLFMENDSCSAVVITLESTSIEACSSGSLVSKGKTVCTMGTLFLHLTVDDMGICVPLNPLPLVKNAKWFLNVKWQMEGVDIHLDVNIGKQLSALGHTLTTLTGVQEDETLNAYCDKNAKWFLNVKWQMEGVDIHLDVNIGKQLSALGHTLTTLTGVQEDETLNAYCDSDEDDDNTNNSQDSIVMKTKSRGTTECLSPLANPHLDPKKRSKLLEKEMYEQVKIISDLRALGASHGTIEQEMRRLHELEALVFRGFRRDMIQKLRRQSIKGKSQIKGKLGLETKTAPGYRSKNYLAGSVSGDLQSDRSKNYLASSVSDDLRSVETEAMLGHEMLASALTQEEIQFKTGSLKHHRVTFSETTGSLSR